MVLRQARALVGAKREGAKSTLGGQDDTDNSVIVY
jgi:hypothetical protein